MGEGPVTTIWTAGRSTVETSAGPIEIYREISQIDGNRIVVVQRNGAPRFFEANDRCEGRYTEPVDVQFYYGGDGEDDGREEGERARLHMSPPQRLYMQPFVAVAAGARRGVNVSSPETSSLIGVPTTPQTILDEGLANIPVVVEVIPRDTQLGGGGFYSSPLFSRPEELAPPSEAAMSGRRLELLTGDIGVQADRLIVRDPNAPRWRQSTLVMMRGDQEVGTFYVLTLTDAQEAQVEKPGTEEIIDVRLTQNGQDVFARMTRQTLETLRKYCGNASLKTLSKPVEFLIHDGWN